jgi:spore germination protein YaaH
VTPPKDATTYANDYVALGKYCDRVQIMTYDQGRVDKRLAKDNTGPYAPVSDPLWVEKVIKLAAQTISKKKLIIGIPTYGYEWTITPTTGVDFTYDRLWAFNPQYAYNLATQFGLTPVRNTAGELSFTYVPQVASTSSMINGVSVTSAAVGPAFAGLQPFNMVWWSDYISVAQKIAIAKKLGVRGVAIFKFDGGEDQKIWDVLAGK